eukprot:6199666-Pleurochrysis_carterae.AAC.1
MDNPVATLPARNGKYVSIISQNDALFANQDQQKLSKTNMLIVVTEKTFWRCFRPSSRTPHPNLIQDFAFVTPFTSISADKQRGDLRREQAQLLSPRSTSLLKLNELQPQRGDFRRQVQQRMAVTLCI